MKYTLHTTLFSDKAYALMTMFKYNVDNGRFIGSRASSKLAYSELVRNDDGEIVFVVDTHEGYHSYNRSIWKKCRLDSAKLRDEIAWMLKCMVREWANRSTSGKSKTIWARDNTTNLAGCFANFASEAETRNLLSDVVTKDIYCVYELLRNRKNLEQKYDESLISIWRGAQFDPVRTELEKAKREQLAEFERQEQDEKRQSSNSFDAELEKFKEEWRKRRGEAQTAITAKFNLKRQELMDEIKQALAYSA